MASKKKEIKNKPDAKVSIKSLTRSKGDSPNLKVSFTLPKQATNDQSERRWEDVRVIWEVNAYMPHGCSKNGQWRIFSDGMATAGYKLDSIKKTSDKHYKFKLYKDVGVNAADRSLLFNAAWLYPRHTFSDKSVINSQVLSTATTYLRSVKVRIKGKNKKGDGPEAAHVYEYKAPARPSISYSANWEGLSISHSASSPKVDTAQQKYSMNFRVVREDNIRGSAYNRSGGKDVWNFDTAEESPSRTTGVTQGDKLNESEWIRFTGYAFARGVYGDSSVFNSGSYVFARPATASITGVSITNTSSSGNILFSINVPNDWRHPVDSVQLEVLKNTTIDSLLEADRASGWEPVDGAGYTTNSGATGLSDRVDNAKPEIAGQHVWYRVVTTHGNYTSRSLPIGSIPANQNGGNAELHKLYKAVPTAEDDVVEILSCESGDDGTSAIVVVGFADKSADDSDGTEISWSTNRLAWESTEEPSTYLLSAVDNPKNSAAGDKWTRTSHIYIQGLTENEKYYVKARRYKNLEDGSVSFGKYSNANEVTPVSTPSSVVLYAPNGILSNEALHLYWTFNSAAQQSEWYIFPNDGSWTIGQDTDYTYSPVAGTYVKGGKDSIGSTDISWEEISPYLIDRKTESKNFASETIPEDGAKTIELIELPENVFYDELNTINVGNSIEYYFDDPSEIIRTNMNFNIPMNKLQDGMYTDVKNWTVYDGEQTRYYEGVLQIQYSAYTRKIFITVSNEGRDRLKITKLGTVDISYSEKQTKISLYVKMKTGGNFANSKPVEINFIDRPIVSVKLDAETNEDGDLVVDSMPVSVELSTYTKNADVIMKLDAAENVAASRPDRDILRSRGENVWASYFTSKESTENVESIIWEETVENGLTLYKSSITIPFGVDIFDGGKYTLYTTVIDTEHNVKSEENNLDFQVLWAHQADFPSSSSRAQGDSLNRVAYIYPVAPENASPDDIASIYRKTPDGVYEIATGIPFGSQVTDRYAPYSKDIPMTYIISTVTLDGDYAWIEVPYNITLNLMRFDWGTTYLELPYNEKYSDSFEKSFEQSVYVNGEVGGNWNDVISRSGSFSTDIIKVDSDQQAKVRELAQACQPVFVRLPNGCAYQADVEVTDISYEYNNPVTAISLTGKEISLTDVFKVSENDIIAPN